MKKLHKITLWLTVLALVLTMAGCGTDADPTTAPTTVPTTAPTTAPTTVPTTAPTEPPITVDQVYASVSDAMTDAEATRMCMDLAYEMSITQGVGDAASTTDVTLDMVVDIMASTEPFGVYTLMDMAMETEGFSMDYTVELYMVEEEGSVVSYTQMFGSWIKTDYDMNVSEFLASGQMTEVSTDAVWSGAAKPEDMTLDEDTQTVNGTEVYVLRGSLPAGDMSEALSNLGVEDPTVYQDVLLPAVYYVDAQTYQILRMEVDMSFMEDLLDEVIAQSIVGTEAEGAQISLTIPTIIYDLEYGIPQIPPVPQEAYDYIANNSDSSGGDVETEPTEPGGPLVLHCGAEALEVFCPEGWSGENVGPENVWIYDEEFSLVGDYYYLTDVDEAYLQSVVSAEVDALKSAETYVSHGEGPQLDGYTTMQVIGNGESYYFAWQEIGDGWLLIYVYDFTGTDDATELLPRFAGYLSPYTE